MIAGEIERLKTQLEKASGELAAIRRQVERMAAHQSKTLAEPFDMFRLSKSKQAVDLAPNTIRSYIDQGLNCYRIGKNAKRNSIVFVSRSELREYIVRHSQKSEGGKPENI